MTIETPELDPSLIFEQDPVQILDALLPLYMNSCLLRSLQEALASELAARMNAMNSATDNAKELSKVRGCLGLGGGGGLVVLGFGWWERQRGLVVLEGRGGAEEGGGCWASFDRAATTVVLPC